MFSSGQPGMFGREDFEKLAPVVDAFSLMTYDYSGPGRSDTHTHTQTDSDGSLMVICFSLISVKIMQKLYDVKFIIRTFKMRAAFWVILFLLLYGFIFGQQVI